MEHTWQSVLEIQMQIWKWVLEISLYLEMGTGN